MNGKKTSMLVITIILILIIIFDIIIAIKNIMTNNIATGILLLVMAGILSVASFRNIKILIDTRKNNKI